MDNGRRTESEDRAIILVTEFAITRCFPTPPLVLLLLIRPVFDSYGFGHPGVHVLLDPVEVSQNKISIPQGVFPRESASFFKNIFGI